MDVKEKLVDIVCNAMESDGCVGHCNNSPCFEVERVVNALMSNGVTVQEWIPVKDRLPEYSNDGFADAVLVTDGFVQHMAYFVGGEWRFAESGEIKEPMWYRITHWMPMPERPKGE